MKSIRIGVMGAANIAQKSVIPAIQATPGFELVAIASRTLEKAMPLAQRFNCEAIEGYDTLLNRSDIDAIYMPLPTGIHLEWVLKTLDAGKHVLVEKSLAMNYAEAQQMIAKAEEKQLVLMENFMFWFHSQHGIVQNLMEQGEIGELRQFRAQFGFPKLAATNFRYIKADGGGAILDTAAYTVKGAQMYLGFDLKVAGAQINIDPKTGVDLFGCATLVNKQGVSAQLSWGFDNYYQNNYEVWGNKGKITAERAFSPQPTFTPKLVLEQQDFRREYTVPADNHFIKILSQFHKNISESTFQSALLEIGNQSKLLTQIWEKAIITTLAKPLHG
jgi:predicted dehydrogenase